VKSDAATRRDLLLAIAAGTAMPFLEASESEASKGQSASEDGIGAGTIAEAEKLHAVTYTASEREQILTTIRGQRSSVEAIRAVPKDRSLMPALHFDPRLPGRSIAPQADRVRTASVPTAKRPEDPVKVAFASVIDQAHWLRTRQITSRELTDIYLERIARIAPKLSCFITVTADLARAQADQADRELGEGRDRGPLHGIPYGIKDVFDTAGVLTTWGAAVFRDRVPAKDAAVVTKLREAGAVLLGKLATGALAYGSRWFGGDGRNPWNVAESAGGSSTGSGSATAAGLVGFSIGTDSLGSILNPSDRCGVTGLRPTFGRISTRDSMPLTPSLTRIGPITRSVEDAALVLAAINGLDAGLPDSIGMEFDYDASLDVSKLTVGYSPRWYETIGFSPPQPVPVSPAQKRVLEELRALGVRLVEVELPKLPILAMFPMLFVETAAVFEDLTLEDKDEELNAGEAGDGWPSLWRQARLYSAVDYVQADRVRRLLMQGMDRLFSEVDILCGPLYGESIELVAATNFTGHPGLTFRVGYTESPTRAILGTVPDPAGPRSRVTQNIAMHGRLFEEGKMLALARVLESRFDVWRGRPPVD
jgi:Asp-tRNA(Asn)/Glu-tRNA(Gln) amidotransferase A subunit family amidase